MSGKYYYAVARTAEVENRLLAADRIDRMIESADADAALKLLSGTDYGDEAARVQSPLAFDRVLLSAERELFDYLSEVSPDEKLSRFFLAGYDIANLKILFKGLILNRPFEHLLTPLGIFGKDRLVAAFETADFSDYPATLGKTAEKLLAVGAENLSAGPMEYELDKAAFALKLEMARKLPSPFLVQYVQAEIDLANLKDFMRVHEKGRAAFYPVFIDGGSIGLDFFDPLYNENLPKLPAALSSTAYGVLAAAAQTFADSGSLTAFEKQSADFLSAYLKQSGQAAFGPEPLAGYVYAKLNEIARLRLVFIGKINKIPAQTIKQRLR